MPYPDVAKNHWLCWSRGLDAAMPWGASVQNRSWSHFLARGCLSTLRAGPASNDVAPVDGLPHWMMPHHCSRSTCWPTPFARKLLRQPEHLSNSVLSTASATLLLINTHTHVAKLAHVLCHVFDGHVVHVEQTVNSSMWTGYAACPGFSRTSVLARDNNVENKKQLQALCLQSGSGQVVRVFEFPS